MNCIHFKCFDCLSADARSYYDANNRVISKCSKTYCCVKCEHLKECYEQARLCAYLRKAFADDKMLALMVLGRDYHTILWSVKYGK